MQASSCRVERQAGTVPCPWAYLIANPAVGKRTREGGLVTPGDHTHVRHLPPHSCQGSWQAPSRVCALTSH